MSTSVTGPAGIKALAGNDLGLTGWLTITQDRVNTFADATGDHQWIHTDEVRARSGPFGGTIAHGYLTLSLILPLFTELLDINGIGMSVNYGLNRVRFPSPVRVGTKIRLRATVGEVTDIPSDGVQMTIDFTVEIDGGDKPACVAQAIVRHYA